MRRLLIALVIGSIAVAACGGNGAATQSNGGGGSGNGAATQSNGGGGGGNATGSVVPTQSAGAGVAGGGGGGGDKPAGWDKYGRVHVEMSGSVSKSTDLGFVPAGSIFGGAQGSSLNFTIDGSNEVVSILVGADGSVVISYGGPDFSMPAATCTTSNWNIGATSGSGSFDCTVALTIMGGGAVAQGGKLTGNFEAHA